MFAHHANRLVISLILLVISFSSANASPGLISRVAHRLPNRYIAFFKDGAVFDPHVVATGMEQQYSVRKEYVFEKSFTGFSFEGPEAAALALTNDPRVLFVGEVGIGHLTSTYQQSNPGWGLDRIDQHNLPLDNIYHYDYRGATPFGASVTIYVLDSGIGIKGAAKPSEFDTDTPGVTRVVAERNFIFDHDYQWVTQNGTVFCDTSYIRTATDVYDRDSCTPTMWVGYPGHGTNVASVAAGRTYGVAKAAYIVNYRVADNGLFVHSDAVVSAMNYMINRHNSMGTTDLAIANLSLTMGGYDDTVDYAVYRALYYGIEVVMAATEFGVDACTLSPSYAGYPGFHGSKVSCPNPPNCPSTYYQFTNDSLLNGITVGATTSSDQVNAGTSWGPCVDIFAPGPGIPSLGTDQYTIGQVTTFGDSSAATAYVSGVAAIQLEQSGLYPVQLEARIKTLATPNVLGPTTPTNWFTSHCHNDSEISGCTPNLLIYSLSY